MKLSIIGVSVTISTLILAGCASHQERESTGAGGPVVTEQTGNQSYLGEQDQKFLKETAQGGLAEVEMGRLGAQKGQNAAVRQLGQKLVQDHSKANQELKLLASQKGVTLPSDIPIEHQSMLSHLKTLEGAEFDKMFKKHAVEEHQKTIEKFKTASEQTADNDVKAFAQKTQPILEQHLKMAQDLPSGEETEPSATTQTQQQSQESTQQPNQQ